MTEPCSQHLEIKELVGLMRDLKDESHKTTIAVSSLQHGHEETARNLTRMCVAHENLATDVRTISEAIHNSIADQRELREKVRENKDDIDVLFDRLRKVEDDDIKHLSAIGHNLTIDVTKINSAIKDIDLITTIDKRLTSSEYIITGIKIIASAVAVGLVGIAITALYGGH